MRTRIALAFVLLPLWVIAAQSPTLAGTWAVDVKAASIETGDGARWNMNALTGTLTLAQKGEEVTGTWQGRMPDPWTVTGTIRKNSFELETETRNIPAEKDGVKTTITRRWIFRGTMDGDKLSGLFILAGGDGEPPAQPFTAARKR